MTSVGCETRANYICLTFGLKCLTQGRTDQPKPRSVR